jgi:hypothetical protein
MHRFRIRIIVLGRHSRWQPHFLPHFLLLPHLLVLPHSCEITLVALAVVFLTLQEGLQTFLGLLLTFHVPVCPFLYLFLQPFLLCFFFVQFFYFLAFCSF